MKNLFALIMLPVILLLVTGHGYPPEKPNGDKFGLVIHGGAGTIKKEKMSDEQEAAYLAKLDETLRTGYKVLEQGGSSLDAVEAAIKVMEDSPLFNAGKGAVFTGDGTNELDASIMDGATLAAGAVSGLKHIKNPIALARLVMEKSPHVMLVGQGAEDFAAAHDIEKVSQYYFFTERRWESLRKQKEKEQHETTKQDSMSEKFADDQGTVGVVALDKAGNLAAGTSTGGMTNKMFGRVGDSPIIGAGTYANNATCAVSGTGHGEYYIRLSIAYDLHALMAYEGRTLQQAADIVIMQKLTDLGGTGGIIAIDKDGHVAMPFNTEGMYRGYMKNGEEPVIKIYGSTEY